MARELGSRKSAVEALLQKMGGGGMPPPDEEAEMAPPPMPEENAPLPEDGMPPGPESSEGMGLESALAGVEAATEGLSEDSAKEIRTHLEAIRDIASREPGMAEAANGTDIREELPPPPDENAPAASPESGMEQLPL